MGEQTASKEIISWVDLIRVVAIYLVVVIHVSGQLTSAWGQISSEQWGIANMYGGIVRVAVPLFFMISGYLLLPRSESLKVFYTKRMTKVLVPFVVWSLIYLGWNCGTHPNTCTPGFIWDLLLVRGSYYHLWFLYSLIGIYLILPVLRLMIRPDTDKTILWYLMLLGLIFQPLLTSADKFWNFSLNIRAPLTGGFVCYFILGYLLGEITLSRLRVNFSAVVWVISTLITIIGTYLLTRDMDKFDGFFYDFVSLNVVMASGAAFILLRWISQTRPLTSPAGYAITRALAISTLGIYLIHPVVIELLSDWIPFLHINPSMGNAIWTIPLVSIIVFFLSFSITRLLQNMPILRQIVP